MNWFTTAEADTKKAEQWVVAEFGKGWQLLQTVGRTADVDILGIHDWIVNHQAQLQALTQVALKAATVAGVVAPPQFKPAVMAATLALNASQAAINSLSASIIDGSTPLSLAESTYHTVKDASSAVNDVLKVATAKPTATPAPAPAAS